MPKDKLIIVDGTAISYRDEGAGRAIVFVHGWRDSKSTFAQLIKQLGEGFRSVSIDLPNFGLSQETDSITSVEEYANFLSLFIKKLNLKDYVLVGHSMGGQINIFATGNNLVKPSSLILLASAGVRSNKKLIKKPIQYVSKVLKRFIPAATKNKLYKKMGSDYNTKLSPVHKKIIHNVLSFDVQDVAGKINVPTLLVFGSNDIHTPVSMGEALHQKIKKSKFVILDDKNHWLHQTDAGDIAKLVKDFAK